MKLNPEALVVTSFDTSDPAAIALPTTGTDDPTPVTGCYWCPPKSTDCPIGTDPGTVVVAD